MGHSVYLHNERMYRQSGKMLNSNIFSTRPHNMVNFGSLAFSYIGSLTAWHSSSGRQPKFAACYKEWNFGTLAAITLGIGPHSSLNVCGNAAQRISPEFIENDRRKSILFHTRNHTRSLLT